MTYHLAATTFGTLPDGADIIVRTPVFANFSTFARPELRVPEMEMSLFFRARRDDRCTGTRARRPSTSSARCSRAGTPKRQYRHPGAGRSIESCRIRLS